MTIEYLKKAEKSAATGEDDTRNIVSQMLAEIETGGEEKAIEYAVKLDNYSGNIVVTDAEIEAASAKISQQVKDDIQFSYDRVRGFAEKQREALVDFEVELSPGLFAGQKQIPVQTAGCYIPGGRYAHVASAVMSVATAKAAGVDHVIACSPPKPGEGVNPAIIYTANLCGADTILAMGGVQGIAAMAFGLFTGHAADILVGPGNRFVAEAKRMLFGRVGIDLFAGPTEIAIIADKTADPMIVASDLVGQAEHGLDSPCWLFTTDRELGEKVLELMPGFIEKLPDTARTAAEGSWRDYGEVVLCSDREEMAQISDQYAGEHLEVQAEDLDWWVNRLRNYGSLFVGEETTVAFGDKCSGTNHILPTKGAGRYTGGLYAGKFIKTVTTQRMSREANREVAAAAARISRLEGMEAHARTGDDRLGKYFPDEAFKLQP
jgi:sulfopropanediol 3-dehydrogenase